MATCLVKFALFEHFYLYLSLSTLMEIVLSKIILQSWVAERKINAIKGLKIQCDTCMELLLGSDQIHIFIKYLFYVIENT